MSCTTGKQLSYKEDWKKTCFKEFVGTGDQNALNTCQEQKRTQLGFGCSPDTFTTQENDVKNYLKSICSDEVKSGFRNNYKEIKLTFIRSTDGNKQATFDTALKNLRKSYYECFDQLQGIETNIDQELSNPNGPTCSDDKRTIYKNSYRTCFQDFIGNGDANALATCDSAARAVQGVLGCNSENFELVISQFKAELENSCMPENETDFKSPTNGYEKALNDYLKSTQPESQKKATFEAEVQRLRKEYFQCFRKFELIQKEVDDRLGCNTGKQLSYQQAWINTCFREFVATGDENALNTCRDQNRNQLGFGCSENIFDAKQNEARDLLKTLCSEEVKKGYARSYKEAKVDFLTSTDANKQATFDTAVTALRRSNYQCFEEFDRVQAAIDSDLTCDDTKKAGFRTDYLECYHQFKVDKDNNKLTTCDRKA